MIRSRVAFVVPLVLFGALLAGCGSTTTSGTPPIKPAAYTPLTAETMAPALTDASKRSGSVHMTMSLGPAGTAEADGAWDSAGLRLQMTMHLTVGGKSGNMEMRVIGGTAYIKVPTNPKFYKIDASTPVLGPLMKQMTSLGPDGLAQLAKAAVTAVDYKGDTQIDGATVHHYVITVDTAKMLTMFGTALPAQVKAALPASMTEDLYLNDNNAPRRVEVLVPGQTAPITIDMTNYGEAVNVVAPPADQITNQPLA